jgi:hypothetical protein
MQECVQFDEEGRQVFQLSVQFRCGRIGDVLAVGVGGKNRILISSRLWHSSWVVREQQHQFVDSLSCKISDTTDEFKVVNLL